MCSDIAISVRNVSKAYRLFHKPADRFKHMVKSGLGLGAFGTQPYDEVWAVNDISFTVERGKTFGIVGTNGSGKSTLLQIIAGVLPPTSGSVTVNGRVTALLELAAGFNPEFTGRENARFNAALFGLTGAMIEQKIAEIEEFADIGVYFDQPVKTYSSGMYVRVGFAVQACIEPDVLIVDEALAVGDARFQMKCMARIKALKERGTSILFVSHDVGSVKALCDQALWIEKGIPRAIGDVKEVTNAYMEYLFMGGETPAIDDTHAIEEALTELPEPETAIPPLSPVKHWGSSLGCIQKVMLRTAKREEKRLFNTGETVTLTIDVNVPDHMDLYSLGVAFSIKNKRSEDLIVGTSWNNGRVNFEDIGRRFRVSFDIPIWLPPADYFISYAVERRVPHLPTEYYEYIDAGTMFQVQHNEQVFGAFVPPLTRRIEARIAAPTLTRAV